MLALHVRGLWGLGLRQHGPQGTFQQQLDVSCPQHPWVLLQRLMQPLAMSKICQGLLVVLLRALMAGGLNW